MNKLELKNKRHLRRKKSIRKKIFGTPERCRLSINRSSVHIYAQIINDEIGKTIVSASTIDKDVRGQIKPGMKKVDQSKLVGAVIAERALKNNIKQVTFDRNGFLYHGRVKALADGAREKGLVF
jgi:large subunit ribosomal protein L18